MWKGKAAEPDGFPTVYYSFLCMLAESLDGFRFRGQVVLYEQKGCVIFPIHKGERAEPAAYNTCGGSAEAPHPLAAHKHTSGDCLAPFLNAVLCFSNE